MAEELVVYGSNWCGYTVMALRHLDALAVTYRYVDVDADPEAERRIAEMNNGRSIRPTVEIGGDVMVNPSMPELESQLQKHGLLSDGGAIA